MSPIRAAFPVLAALVLACGGAVDAPPDPGADLLAAVAGFRADPQHSGVYATAAVHHPPRAKWIFPTRGPVRSSPVVAAGRVFFGSGDGRLYALDAAGGAESWRFPTGGRVLSSPAFDRGRVYFGSFDGSVYALDAGAGSVAVDQVGTVLAVDERGRAGAWVKSFGGPPGTGFVRLWGGRPAIPDPDVVRAVAAFGLE